MGANFGALIALGVGCRVIAYFMMHLISTPKRPKLNEKKQIKAWLAQNKTKLNQEQISWLV